MIKLFARLNLYLGLLFRNRRPDYDFSSIKTVLLKRTDRIGDAAVTLPLILELSRHFDVTVLTSRYNDALLKEFVKTTVFTDEPRDFPAAVRMIAGSIFLPAKRKSGVPARYDLCLDFNGVRELDIFLKIRENNLCRYYAGFNLVAWNRLLDYAYREYPALFSGKHIVDSCRSLIAEALGLELKSQDQVDFSGKLQKPPDFSAEDFLFVNISGAEKFRGPFPDGYARIIDSLSFKGPIVVMDELGRPHLEEFKQRVKRQGIIYLDKDCSLWELLYIASRSILYLGSDSGISNLLQYPAHAIIFFATGAPWTWRPYSRNPYKQERIKKLVVEETVTSAGLRKIIIYARVWCRPCFDFGCRGYRCNKNIDIAAVAGIINSTLESIIKDRGKQAA